MNKGTQAPKPANANKAVKLRQAVSQARTVQPKAAARPDVVVRKTAAARPVSNRPVKRNVVELTGGAGAASILAKLGAERQRSMKRNASQKARK